MLSLVSVICVAATVVSAEPDAKQVDPTGTWKWERTFGDTHLDYTLRLKLDKDGKVTGTYASRRNETEREPAKIEDAKVHGDKLSFSITRSRNGREFTLMYEGTVSDEGLTGFTKVNFNGNPREFEWTAKRVVEIADVIGTWQLRFETPNGNVIEPTLKLSKDGKNLKGTFVSRRGEREIKDIIIKENQLLFQFTFERNGNTSTIKFTGKPRGDSMKGTLESNFGGEARKTEVDGKRLPEKAKKNDKEEADTSND